MAGTIASALLGATALGLGLTNAASAAELFWFAGTSGTYPTGGATWDTTNTNWSLTNPPTMTAPPADPWNLANGPTNIARFNIDNDVASISGTVYPSSIRFSGDDAVVNSPGVIGFATTTSIFTLRADAGKTGTINANFLGTGITSGSGNRIDKTFAGKVILTGNVKLSGDFPTNTLPSVNSAVSLIAGFTVEGGGELEVTGELKAADPFQGGNRSNFTNLIGGTSANNTLTISGSFGTQVHGGGMTLGVGAANGNNSVYITRPGNATSGTNSYRMTGNSAQLNIGLDSDNNYFEVSNGATFIVGASGGTGTWSIGKNAGADNNSLVVSGTNSSISRGTNNAVNVGESGSSNSYIIQNGGTVNGGRVAVGTSGTAIGQGSNNMMKITGANSLFRTTAVTTFIIGGSGFSTGNSFQVGPGARTDMFGSGTAGPIGVGGVSGADSNFVSVSGAGAQMNFLHSGLPLVVGGRVSGSTTVTTGGLGNYLQVDSGGLLFMDNADSALGLPPSNPNFTYGAAPTNQTALVLTGGSSLLPTYFQLGNGGSAAAVGSPGTPDGTAKVGKTPGVGGGTTAVVLNSSTSQLRMNNGRLIATSNILAPTILVSGVAGSMIELQGPGYFSNTINAEISAQISGVGRLVKEGSGTLTLSNPLNDYSGDTEVFAGVLTLNNALLDDASTVYIDDDLNSAMNLNFAGGDTIAKLFIGGVQMAAGTWGNTFSGASNVNDTVFDNIDVPFGTGYLNVLEGPSGPVELVPEPSTLVLAAIGLIGMGLVAWRRKRTVCPK